MAGLLGLRQITRLRYGSPSYSGLDPVRPSPTSEQIWASVDLAPRSEWAHDDGGQRTRRVVEVITRTDLRGADDGAQTYADRLEIDGRTYEVQTVDRLDPFEGDGVAHFEARAVEVQPLGDATGTPTAPVNLVIPTIQGTIAPGEDLTLTAGLWDGTGPITFTYSLTLDGDVVSTSTSYTLPGDYDGETLLLTVQATGPGGGPVSAQSQPIGGGGVVDCEVTCADAISAAVAAAVAPLNATIASQAATIVDLNGQIVALNDEIDALEDEVTALEATVASQAATIATQTAQLAARVPLWRSVGKLLTAGTPIVHDPSALADGAYSIDADGVLTMPMLGGISGANPATGYSLLIPMVNVNGRVPATFYQMLQGAIRVYASSGIVTSTTIRWWAGVVNENTLSSGTVDGWGVGGFVGSGSGHRAALWRCANGTWTATSATSDPGGQGPIEGLISMGARRTDLYGIARRIDPTTGLAPAGGGATQAAKADITSGFLQMSFAAGAWLFIGVGQSGTGAGATTPVVRGLAALVALDQAEAVGAGAAA